MHFIWQPSNGQHELNVKLILIWSCLQAFTHALFGFSFNNNSLFELSIECVLLGKTRGKKVFQNHWLGSYQKFIILIIQWSKFPRDDKTFLRMTWILPPNDFISIWFECKNYDIPAFARFFVFTKNIIFRLNSKWIKLKII